MDENELGPPPTRAWTRVEDYFASLARRRTERRRREPGMPRTQPETPRFSLSILPFLALLAALAVLAVVIAIDAWPGRERAQLKPQPRELGTAPPGWLEEAKGKMRELRNS